MNEELMQALRTGKIPYRYEYDTASALYFAGAIVAVAFVYALAQAVTRKLVG